jgi:5-methylcytosine-specific restriction endonuclease McrA
MERGAVSIEGTVWAFDQKSLTPAAKLLLIHVADNACDAEPRVYRLERLREFACIDDIAAPLAELVAKRLIGVVDENGTTITICAYAPWTEWARGPSEPPRPKISVRLRMAIYKRDGMACMVCGADEPLSIDHIVPVSKGGGNEPENLQTLCKPCNTSKGDRDFQEWLETRREPAQ